MGLFMAFVGIRENLLLVIIPGLFFFMTLPFVNTGIEVLIRKNIGNELQGRAWALISFITYLGALLAFATAGSLADRVFNPLLCAPEAAGSVPGIVFGTGRGRGIALLFSLSGVSVVLLSVLTARSASIRALEEAC
jgi:hypothetical protein